MFYSVRGEGGGGGGGGGGGATSPNIVFSVVSYGFHVMFVTWPEDRAFGRNDDCILFEPLLNTSHISCTPGTRPRK